MRLPPVPLDEAERLTALAATDLFDTPAEERFDRLTRLATRVFDVPIALITLVGADRQFFKSAQGVSVLETPREVSFCAHAIAQHDARAAHAFAAQASPLVVPDSLDDARFKDNPVVTGTPPVRFYAGVPLRHHGQPIGTLCLIDHRPRHPDAGDLATLADLAALAEAEIQRRMSWHEHGQLVAELARVQARANIDVLTRCWSREAILVLLGQEAEHARDAGSPLTVIMIDVDHFKSVNDTWGHPVGDEVLLAVADRIRQGIRPGDAVGRLGGDELVVVLPDCPADAALQVAERVRRRVQDTPVGTREGPVAVTMSLGIATLEGAADGRTLGGPEGAVDALVVAADRALYAAKASGRNAVRAHAGRA